MNETCPRLLENEYQDKAGNSLNEMSYDANGNMIKDLDRDIVTIKYNLLNLPDLIQFKNGCQIKNTYSADGQKLSSRYVTVAEGVYQPLNPGQVIENLDVNENDNVTVDGTDYVGNIEYQVYRYFNWDVTFEPAELKYLWRVHNPEGYVSTFGINSSYGPAYNYYRKDHLGNNREVWNASYKWGSATRPAATNQITQYYPSGLPWKYNTGDSPDTQPYKYGGKEFVEMHGWDEYDSEARWYYPAIMRTTTMDPLAEKYYDVSPYAWCLNNPVNAIDPDGRQVFLGGSALTNGMQRVSAFFINNSDFQDLFILGSAVVAAVTGGEPKQFEITTNSDGQINGVKLQSATGDDVNAAKSGLLLPVVGGTAVKKTEKLLENVANGKAFEKQVGKSLGNNKASQVTIEATDGTITKVDFAHKQNGKVTLIEAKSSQTAPLTGNQKVAHPQIETSGGTVKGIKGTEIGLPAGTKIPPTKVQVIRPEDLLRK